MRNTRKAPTRRKPAVQSCAWVVTAHLALCQVNHLQCRTLVLPVVCGAAFPCFWGLLLYVLTFVSGDGQ